MVKITPTFHVEIKKKEEKKRKKDYRDDFPMATLQF